MRRPTRQLVITFILGLIIGYGVSWAVMIWMGAELRFYGLGALTLMAILVDLLIIFALDGPLNLKAFDWPAPEEEASSRDDNLKHFLAVGLLIVVIGGLTGAWLNSAELLPVAASAESIPIDNLMSLHFVVIGFLFALVMVFMGYSVVVFRRKPGDTEDGTFIHGNTPLEVVWTIVPLIIVIYFGYLGHMAFNEIRTLKPDAMVVEVHAFQWGWSFSYPEYDDKKSIELNLPRDRQIVIRLTSEDVLHSFWVPEFRVKQDAVPGRAIDLLVTPTMEGEYKLRCAEMCGTAHSTMVSTVNVMSPENFEAWATGTAVIEEDTEDDPVARGEALAAQCLACHTINGGEGLGPTWKGIFGQEETLDDGTTVIVDEEYIKESILKPNIKIVQGFNANVMPPIYADILSEQNIDDIIAYIKTLE